MSHESHDDMEYDPSNVEFSEWLASKKFNYKTMDHYTIKALWIYWTRGDDEVELTDKESSDFKDEDEVAKKFRIETNVFDFETPLCRAFKEFNYLYLLHFDPDNKDVPWVHEKPWTDDRAWKEPAPRDDGYCNGENLPGAYIVGNLLRYQDFEWYEARKDGKLKEKALKNKTIMEGIIKDEDNECNEGWKRSNVYENTIHAHEEREYEMEHEDKKRRELFDDHEWPVCNIIRFKMIKYSFGQDEEYVAVKENEYDDFTSTIEDACRTYQDIFRMMDKGWMVTHT
uniref:C2 calcium/lipid-binding domain, CaLB n=1 Tax=Tanacetum cinerariifolium TaxID=118510 RepID=A0A6L2LKP6_TANCI|nr:C2 calcium/lipid-binding domain, CaLB [Tanacetum cinerariifolium]